MSAVKLLRYHDQQIAATRLRLTGLVELRDVAVRDHEHQLRKFGESIVAAEQRLAELESKLPDMSHAAAEEERQLETVSVEAELEDLATVDRIEAHRLARIAELSGRLSELERET